MQKMPPVTRNLLIANVICYLIQTILRGMGIDMTDWLGLHFVLARDFHLFQLVSYMFLHGSLTHLFFNMFSLWMFGGLIERTLGMRRFIAYYFVCGIGAGLCQEVWQMADYLIEGMGAYETANIGGQLMPMGDFLNLWTTIGASGACYGVLLAFGMLYPNERIMLLIPPIPMKAKYFVAGYAAIELFSAYASNDNVAHFAHLGGMLFGWLLLRTWRRQSRPRTANWWEQGRERKPSWTERLKSAFGRKKETTPGNARHTATRDKDYDYNMKQKENEARMDEILDKIRLSGYDSLTREEKQELFHLSRK